VRPGEGNQGRLLYGLGWRVEITESWRWKVCFVLGLVEECPRGGCSNGINQLTGEETDCACIATPVEIHDTRTTLCTDWELSHLQYERDEMRDHCAGECRRPEHDVKDMVTSRVVARSKLLVQYLPHGQRRIQQVCRNRLSSSPTTRILDNS
jgi:hypothetical protein